MQSYIAVAETNMKLIRAAIDHVEDIANEK
jgi:hypothetical protein